MMGFQSSANIDEVPESFIEEICVIVCFQFFQSVPRLPSPLIRIGAMMIPHVPLWLLLSRRGCDNEMRVV